MISIDRSTGLLILSIMVFLLSVYKLGNDIRAYRLKTKRKTSKERFIAGAKKRWICTHYKKETP